MIRSPGRSASAKNSGELVRSVVAGGPASRGGLQQGDVIVGVGGHAVSQDQSVSYLIANSKVGSRVPLDVIRKGKRQTVYVTLGDRPTEEQLAKISGGGSGPGRTPRPPTRRRPRRPSASRLRRSPRNSHAAPICPRPRMA